MLHPSPIDSIRSSFNADGVEVYTATFDLAAFFALPIEQIPGLGWKLVQTLQNELPTEHPWITYRLFEGRLTITGLSHADVAANLLRLEVLANLEGSGLSL